MVGRLFVDDCGCLDVLGVQLTVVSLRHDGGGSDSDGGGCGGGGLSCSVSVLASAIRGGTALRSSALQATVRNNTAEVDNSEKRRNLANRELEFV